MKKKSCPVPGSVPGWGLEQPLRGWNFMDFQVFPTQPSLGSVEQREDFQLGTALLQKHWKMLPLAQRDANPALSAWNSPDPSAAMKS